MSSSLRCLKAGSPWAEPSRRIFPIGIRLILAGALLAGGEPSRAQTPSPIGIEPKLLDKSREELAREQEKHVAAVRERLRQMKAILTEFNVNCHRDDLDKPEFLRLKELCAALKKKAEDLSKENAADIAAVRKLTLPLLVLNVLKQQGSNALGGQFKRWVVNVPIEEGVLHGSPGMPSPELGVIGGRLRVYDSFWEISETRQTNLLTFELGKVLWYKINGDDVRVPQTKDAKNFVALVERNRNTMSADTLRAAPWRDDHLSQLADLGDTQSYFSYAFRVAALDLEPPVGANFKQEWQRARVETRDYFTDLLSRSR